MYYASYHLKHIKYTKICSCNTAEYIAVNVVSMFLKVHCKINKINCSSCFLFVVGVFSSGFRCRPTLYRGRLWSKEHGRHKQWELSWCGLALDVQQGFSFLKQEVSAEVQIPLEDGWYLTNAEFEPLDIIHDLQACVFLV